MSNHNSEPVARTIEESTNQGTESGTGTEKQNTSWRNPEGIQRLSERAKVKKIKNKKTMYPMDKFSAMMWLETITKAQAGDKQEAEMLQAENQIRTENNQPTVEDELKELTKTKDQAPTMQQANPFYPYNNQFHKESEERKLKKLDEQKNLKLNSKEEAENYKELLQKRLLNLQIALSLEEVMMLDGEYIHYGTSEIWNLRQEIYHTISILRSVRGLQSKALREKAL